MRFLACLLCLFLGITVWSQPLNGEEPSINNHLKSSGCVPSSGQIFLEYNNVKALLHTGGHMWQVSGQNTSMYEVPKNSGIMALFTSALWLGGQDINGQLKLAAMRYKQGHDYWTGPLTVDGDATVTASTCLEYDRHFVVSQDMVREFDAWYKAGLQDQANGTNTQQEQFPNYVIPEGILDWPAHGDVSLGQDFYLAPFYDRDHNGLYEPAMGDYPWYDIEGEVDCRNDRDVTLYGDHTIWWVMNDKGNIHTETQGEPIGMEIHAQAFAFATNDEVNNMTFYNYELINRGTQTLYDTYFGVFVDVALGGPWDDYVGCDVSRGLGYSYNGRAVDSDDQGWKGYGANPPAIGVDFFEGPYQDNDGIDNAIGIGPGEAVKGNGLGYGDGIVDNERFGMRRFVYYSNTGSGGNAAQTDPVIAQEYYDYLRGYWKDGTRMVYGGSGHPSDALANATMEADFMFPGDSDPLGWGTNGIPQPNWTEQTAGNLPYDRRFVQSAGPFVLRPGAVNNITVGVCYARSAGGDPYASVEALKKADDKAQALFENCFKIMDGPHAPDVTIQEMENELIISLVNSSASNNYNDEYQEVDPFLPVPDNSVNFDNTFRFQGYQVYQVKDPSVSVSDIDDPDLARLVFQCDVEDNVSQLINFEFDEDLQTSVPKLMVQGENKGIRHTFSVKTDMFAEGDNQLVNFKKYHYIAVAYAHNNYKTYIPDDASAIDGQKEPYLRSRKAAIGEILVHSGIPHNPIPEADGTWAGLSFGDGPEITMTDGYGNGHHDLVLTSETESTILQQNSTQRITYASGHGPIEVKVVDPLLVEPNSDYRLAFGPVGNVDTAQWYITRRISREGQTEMDTVTSLNDIGRNIDQLIPQWGIAIHIYQRDYFQELHIDGNLDSSYVPMPQVLNASMVYEDSSKRYFTGIPDNASFGSLNWIASGDYVPDPTECTSDPVTNPCMYTDAGIDIGRRYDDILGGIIAPFKLCRDSVIGAPIQYPQNLTNVSIGTITQGNAPFSKLVQLNSILVVLTPDKSKWSRCPVLEMNKNTVDAEGGAYTMQLREAASVDKGGNKSTASGSSTNESDAHFVSNMHMGWFPGYAIDLETGERLNVAFSENSYLAQDNGRDMQFNPSSRYFDNVGNTLFGGMHYFYVFDAETSAGIPAYDHGEWLLGRLQNMTIGSQYLNTWKWCRWVGSAMKAQDQEWLSNEMRMHIQVNQPFDTRTLSGDNADYPAFEWSFGQEGVRTSQHTALDTTLSMIRAVPNPYLGYAEYESNSLDQRMKLVNLPERCNIKIYNVGGQLVRAFKKDDPNTYLDWDLKNENHVPISSGLYLMHIDVPGVGETVVKFFCSMRTYDLKNF